MQEEIRSVDAFLERTDRLAEKLGIPLRQLPERIGISPASLFGYRSGKIPLSDKAWSKLEQLERNSLTQPLDRTMVRQNPSDLESQIRDLISDPAWEQAMLEIRNSSRYLRTIDQIRAEVRECIQEGRAPTKDLLLLVNEIEQMLIGIGAGTRVFKAPVSVDANSPPP